MNTETFLLDKLKEVMVVPNRGDEYRYSGTLNLIPGIGIDLGVFNGRSTYKLADSTKLYFYGFDSFEGLPEKWDLGNKIVNKGHFKVDKVPENTKNCEFIKGWFEDTLPIFEVPSDISYLNIDSDLYSSAILGLKTFNRYIVEGTIIRFDDLLDSPNLRYLKWKEGEWKALLEWLEECNRKVEPIFRNTKQSGAFRVVK